MLPGRRLTFQLVLIMIQDLLQIYLDIVNFILFQIQGLRMEVILLMSLLLEIKNMS